MKPGGPPSLRPNMTLGYNTFFRVHHFVYTLPRVGEWSKPLPRVSCVKGGMLDTKIVVCEGGKVEHQECRM